MNVEVANKLVKLRKSHGFSQEDLAEQLGVSRQAVSKWERAEASPDTENLITLSKIYSISIDDILDAEIEIANSTEVSRKTGKQMTDKQEAWAAIGSMIAVISFMLTGFLLHAWAYNWVVFLIIPVFYYIPVISKRY
ncbi:MAG: helix-turn-helix transcriptional regulator [Eubacteriales bacterium]